MCDIDMYVEYTAYEPVGRTEIELRKEKGRDLGIVGWADDFIGKGADRIRVQWELWFDYTTDERLRVLVT